MKRFVVPLVDKQFRIYLGKDEWEKFQKYALTLGMHKDEISSKSPVGDSGRCFGGAIWIENTENRAILIHELSHFIDDLISLIDSRNIKGEFRAYITEWVIDKALDWLEGLNDVVKK